MVLGADICKVETLAHHLFCQFHIGSRCHVPAVPTGVAVVVVIGLKTVEIGVGAEMV